jgi:hypothetical protein
VHCLCLCDTLDIVTFACGHSEAYTDKVGQRKCAVCHRYRERARYFKKQIPGLEAELKFVETMLNITAEKRDYVRWSFYDALRENLLADLTRLADKIEALELARHETD